jgi:hypothetical protein
MPGGAKGFALHATPPAERDAVNQIAEFATYHKMALEDLIEVAWCAAEAGARKPWVFAATGLSKSVFDREMQKVSQEMAKIGRYLPGVEHVEE